MIRHLFALALLGLVWLGCFGLCRELAARKKLHPDWRLSWMLACVAWGAMLTFIIEVTSSLRVLNAPVLFTAWAIASVLCCGAAVWLGRQRDVWNKNARAVWLDRVHADWKGHWPLDAKLMLLLTSMLTFVLGIIAVATPTTNWDSLTYHLPRVMHWIQHQSIEHFPTNNTCEIEYGPWSAFVALTLHLLAGSDRLDNLAQWFAMVTCAVVGSFVAQQLLELRPAAVAPSERPKSSPVAARRRITAFTCLLIATLPIGIVESVTTQNDYVVTAWLIGLASLLLALGREPDNIFYAVGAGLALALGILTKATMFIYAAPIGASFLLWWLLRLREGRLRLKLAFIFAIALLVINAPHWLRNYAVFGSPLGSRQIVSTQRNKNFSASGTSSNVLRNLALQTNTGIRPLTDALNASLFWLHRFTGRKLDDPDITFHSGTFGVPDHFLVFDGYACNLYHLALAAIAGAVLLRNPKRDLTVLACFAIVAAGFVLFCALLRWQMWHGRIHIAWLVLLVPLTGTVLATGVSRWLVWTASVWVSVFGIYCLANNASRPVLDRGFTRLPREQQYLQTMMPQSYAPLVAAADAIVAARCDRVGLKLGYDDPEYAIWVLLRNRGFSGRIDHWFVENESSRLPAPVTLPCVVLTSFSKFPAAVTNAFPRQTNFGRIALLWPEPARP